MRYARKSLLLHQICDIRDPSESRTRLPKVAISVLCPLWGQLWNERDLNSRPPPLQGSTLPLSYRSIADVARFEHANHGFGSRLPHQWVRPFAENKGIEPPRQFPDITVFKTDKHACPASLH